MDPTDDDDLLALRELVKRSKSVVPAKPRGGVRRGTTGPSVQLNVRVRPEVSEHARQIAEETNSTIAEVVERAIEELFTRHGGAR